MALLEFRHQKYYIVEGHAKACLNSCIQVATLKKE
jgi:hypothetical protein